MFSIFIQPCSDIPTADLYKKQLDFFGKRMTVPPVTAVFFGRDAVPVTPEFVGEILAALQERMGLVPECQVTVEADPVGLELFAAYKDAGANRLSLTHFEVEAAQAAAKIFPSWSVDMAYGRTDYPLPQWMADVEALLALNPSHVALEEDDAIRTYHSSRAFYDRAAAAMADQGLQAYSFCHFAQAGHTSRYLEAYGQLFDYWGLGPQAVGLYRGQDGRLYLSEGMAAAAWKEDMQADGSGLAAHRALPIAEVTEILLQQGLQHKDGVSWQRLEAVTGQTHEKLFDPNVLEFLQQKGLIYPPEDGLRVTEEGLWRLSGVVEMLLEKPEAT